jgi:short-subunit dehydrogenase
MELAGSVALVTGASSGIGAATAKRLARAGASVLVHGRDPGRTAETAAAVGGAAVVADLSGPDGVDALAAEALAAQGQVDVVVLNAGRGHSGPFVEMGEAEIEDLLALDLAGQIRLARRLLPGMLALRSGHLCFVSSIAGRTGVAGEAVYAAAKAGLDAFAESLRLELNGSGVTVSVVVPGVVDTDFFTHRGRPYDRATPAPVSADAVAAAIVDAVARERAEVYVPRWLQVAPTVRSLAPGPFRTLSARFGEQVRSLPGALS